MTDTKIYNDEVEKFGVHVYDPYRKWMYIPPPDKCVGRVGSSCETFSLADMLLLIGLVIAAIVGSIPVNLLIQYLSSLI